jgi:glycosyltransferase involved in cell wall biosynthesis
MMTIKSVSFVFPMYNEADGIESTIRRATMLAGQISDDYEIVIADDASTDGGAGLVAGIAAKDPHIKLICLESNSKFGGALKAGLLAASKDVIIYMDSDFPAREDDIRKALSLLNEADIITAYSVAIKDTSPKRIIMSKVYNGLVQLLFGLHIKDINSGLKIYKREALDGLALKSMSPFIDVEIFAKTSRRGYRIKQYGLIFEQRSKGVSTISRAGVVARTFWDMFTYRFGW